MHVVFRFVNWLKHFLVMIFYSFIGYFRFVLNIIFLMPSIIVWGCKHLYSRKMKNWIPLMTHLVDPHAVVLDAFQLQEYMHTSKSYSLLLTLWGRATHICFGKLTTIVSDNGLSPGRRQATIWTIAGILLIGPLGTNFSEILTGIQTFSFKKMRLKNVVCEMASILSRPQCVNTKGNPLHRACIYWPQTDSQDSFKTTMSKQRSQWNIGWFIYILFLHVILPDRLIIELMRTNMFVFIYINICGGHNMNILHSANCNTAISRFTLTGIPFTNTDFNFNHGMDK